MNVLGESVPGDSYTPGLTWILSRPFKIFPHVFSSVYFQNRANWVPVGESSATESRQGVTSEGAVDEGGVRGRVPEESRQGEAQGGHQDTGPSG